jgi:Acetyltransferase (GNAT) domain
MNSEYSIVKLTEDKFDILIPLMKDCFGLDLNIKYFEWKFKNNPAGFVEGYYALHSSGEVAAYYGVIPENYYINGEKTLIYQSCDTMTHSNHRRKGLFQKLANHCYDDLRSNDKLFVIGFGGGQSTPGFIKFGWLEIFKIRYYFYPRAFKFFQRLKHNFVDAIDNYEEIEHLTILSNSNSIIHSNKSSKIYKWRCSNPLHEYKTVAVKGDNNAYSSYLTYYEENDKIVLFDFFISDKNSGSHLFNFIKSKLTSMHKGIISFVQENSKWSNTLKGFSFIANPFNKGPLHEKVPFIFLASNDKMNLFKDEKKWQINSFDHDAL